MLEFSIAKFKSAGNSEQADQQVMSVRLFTIPTKMLGTDMWRQAAYTIMYIQTFCISHNLY